jgi:hypothetical protein
MVRHIGFDPSASFNVKLPPSINSSMYLPFDSDLNDDSPNAFFLTGTAVGGASISTSVKKFGAGSLSLNGSNQYIRFGGTTSGFGRSITNLENEDFTIEAWVYTLDSSINPIVGRSSGASARSFALEVDGNGSKIVFKMTTDGSSNTLNSYTWHNGSVTTNNWHHVAVVRSGTQLYCFLNGVSDPSPSITGGGIGTKTIYFSSAELNIGYYQYSGQYFNGYIDDYRYFKGTALYTSNFVPPTAALGSTSLTPNIFTHASTFSVDQMREGLAAGTWPSS